MYCVVLVKSLESEFQSIKNRLEELENHKHVADESNYDYSVQFGARCLPVLNKMVTDGGRVESQSEIGSPLFATHECLADDPPNPGM